MDGFFRRGDVWWARLAVPARLRQAAGRREFVQSCRTTDKHAGRVVAAALLAQWRRQLFELEGGRVDIQKLIGGGPALVAGGHLSLQRGVELLGFDLGDLLRAASAGRIGLHCRIPSGAADGFVVPLESLEPVDAEMGHAGGVVIPSPKGAPNDSIRAQMVGQVLPLVDSAIVASQVLAGELDAVELVCMEAPARPGWLYVPDVAPVVPVVSLEVLAGELDALRAAVVAAIPAERVVEPVRAAEPPTPARGGRWAGKRFSEALEAYCVSPDGLPKTLASEVEQRQRKAGMMLFPEFMGDLLLGEIDGDVLRAYRDGPLKTLPGKANHLPKEVKRPTMKATIESLRVARPDWPLMTADMRRERMLWLARFFAWLQARGYMDTDPAAGLAGESGVSKADAKAARRDALAVRKAAGDDDEGRGPFSGEELKAIFLQPLFVNGHGRHIVGAERCGPHEFWLPLLGLFGGLRLKEASQLYLSDVRQVDGVVWCLDLNENTADKSLKNDQSARLVPLHPALDAAGFLDYCDRLRLEGFQRVFPELTCVASDARYSKDSGRRMSMMLERLGMPRDGGRVFHSFRHNMNNALLRVPTAVLGYADDTLVKVARHGLLGHDLPPELRSVNTRTYLRGKTSEVAALVAAVRYDGLPVVAPFDSNWGIEAIRDALGRKHGDRKGKEDMGEVWTRRAE